ncbi:hypothetical protein B0A49_10202 [Cryomyces minteri]|uniref:U-box domain-containing protein n=1 Tax=Cryomyces minteri TaxID=331657 RepID=A0A4U0W1J9_9PEZI|nr:hypothetical protein B0A49_10202 [Cryomyces minteri]
MSDSTLSDAEKIRQRRLAKLGAAAPSPPNGQPPAPGAETPTASTPPVASTPSEPASSAPEALPPPASQNTSIDPNPFDQPGVKAQSKDHSRINITSGFLTAQKRDNEGTTRPRSRQGATETLEAWEDKTMSSVFRLTLDPEVTKDAHGHSLHFVAGVRSDLVEQGAPLQLSTTVLDQAILEAASNVTDGKPLDYLLACWKRVSRAYRGMRSGSTEDPKHEVLKEARRLCMSYCIFAATMPEMFGMEPIGGNMLAEHLLVDPDNDVGLCHDFLSEAVLRFPEDDTIKEALVGAVEQLSRDLSKMSMNDNYKPYVLALHNLARFNPLAVALTKSPTFLPPDVPAQEIESKTLLGPFFHLSPMQAGVALSYFSSPETRDKAYVANSQKALRMTLQTHQTDLFDIVNSIIKAGKEPRERMLDWFALTINANHKKRAMRVDPRIVSSDGFMVNVAVCLDQLCEPFMDATFSKIDRIDVNYLRRNPRVSVQEETKINADQKTSDSFYEQKVDGTSNFISEIFFLTVAAHHYGTEAANTKLSSLQKDIKHMKKELEKFEAERHKFVSNPINLQRYELHLKKYKDAIERGQCVVLATEGALLDELTQARSMQFMRYVVVWLLRLASGQDIPKQALALPLPESQPDAFRCLPEYFIEDIVDNFKFVTRNMPQIIIPTQSEELATICITFLRSSEYVKSPYLKSGLVTILFNGVWPVYNRAKGVLGDQLNGSPFAHKHLLHALMQFYIECESTGTHTQFFDKFNIRYEIFQIIKCIWTNTIYREELAKEAKVNLDFFVRFVNLLLNDVTFVLDESFSAFHKINELTKELRAPDASSMDATVRQEKEELLADHKGRAKSYMGLTTETIAMLKLFTEALADSFTMPEIVQRLADMLDYNLDALVGDKQGNLKVENPKEYNFVPQHLVADLFDVYINLSTKDNFQHAIARDGRSYRPGNFVKAAEIMRKYGLKSKEELQAWIRLGTSIQEIKEEEEQAEEDLGEIPDEFLDPLMATLMEDPVILPKSRITIDRSTIRSHLLSDPTDPFNRVPMKIEDVVPDEEMKAKIAEFRAAKKGKKPEEDSMDTSGG